MKKDRLNIFSDPVFLVNLLALLVNDYYLKNEFSNWFTGKLSDFSGLFIFTLALYYFFPKKDNRIVYTVSFFFLFWKSPYSQDFINFLNTFSNFKFGRVVDYTDLFALSSIYFAKKYYFRETFSFSFNLYFWLKIPIFGLTLIGIMGTSFTMYSQEFHIRQASSEKNFSQEKVLEVVESALIKRGFSKDGNSKEKLPRIYKNEDNFVIIVSFDQEKSKVNFKVIDEAPRSLFFGKNYGAEIAGTKMQLVEDLKKEFKNLEFVISFKDLNQFY